MILSIHSIISNHQLVECLPSSLVCTKYPLKDESSMPWTLRKPVIYEWTWGPSRLFLTGSLNSNGLFALKSISICLSCFLIRTIFSHGLDIDQLIFFHGLHQFHNDSHVYYFMQRYYNDIFIDLFFASNYWISIICTYIHDSYSKFLYSNLYSKSIKNNYFSIIKFYFASLIFIFRLTLTFSYIKKKKKKYLGMLNWTKGKIELKINFIRLMISIWNCFIIAL